MQGKHLIAMIAAAAFLSSAALAGPPAKKPSCQTVKGQPRESKRPEPCRKPAIPPMFDQTPIFLASAAASPVAASDHS